MKEHSAARIEKWYRGVGLLSVGAVLFLILVGGIVRSTGSGMGCPDWPRCFGLLVPPTEVSEIPPAFFEQHPEYQAKDFNVAQTWTEYLNRLTGAIIGLLMMIVAALSIAAFWRKDRRIVVLSVSALLMTGFEGWLGKLVVDKNLEGGMVTIHMLVAILILGTLITAVYLASQPSRHPDAPRHPDAGGTSQNPSTPLQWLGLAVVLLTVAQILLGTQIREQIDAIAVATQGQGRDTWTGQLDWQYAIHKVLWMVLLALIVVWVRALLRQSTHPRVRTLALVMLAGLAGEVLLGIMLTGMALPPVLQPLHLLFANVIFAAEYGLLIHIVGVERLFAGKNKIAQPLNRGRLADAKQ